MFTTVYVAGKRVRLDPSDAINKGGEADIYRYGPGELLKIYKTPDHPDILAIADPQERAREQEGARTRLIECQDKLPAFPKGLPKKVVSPMELATQTSGQIVGFTMASVDNAEVIRMLSDKDHRLKGVPNNLVVATFLGLHASVGSLHSGKIVVGDFNDLNVLIRGTDAYMIDADSFDFGRWRCKSFTTQFVDPMRCDPKQTFLLLNQPHNADSDWYAYTVMLFRSLLFVDPYGGVYIPKSKARKITHDSRPLYRITVFNPEVRYPKPALPLKTLPDEMLDFFQQTFEKDKRGEFPLLLLQNLRWTKCTNCGFEHARTSCPQCMQPSPAAVKQKSTVRGTVTATRVFATSGQIVHAAFQGGKLRWIVNEEGKYKREDDSTIVGGSLDSQLRFRISSESSVLAKNDQMVTISPSGTERELVDTFGNSGLPVIDANEKHRYWTYDGRLMRSDSLGPEFIGNVLSGQTLFWVGDKMGFGFYRAGGLFVAFVFDPERQGINDNVQMTAIPGQLIDSTCVFARDRCWFMVSYRSASKTTNRCTVVRADGTIEATAEASEGDGSWLGTLRGKAAISNFLLAATDDGVVRIEPDQGQLVVTRQFPDTETWVDTNVHLFPAPQGLYVVRGKEIYLLVIK